MQKGCVKRHLSMNYSDFYYTHYKEDRRGRRADLKVSTA